MAQDLIIPVIISSSGVVVSLLGVLYGIFRGSKKDKEKFATKHEVKEAVINIEKNTDLKIENAIQHSEEDRAILEYIKKHVEGISYRLEKHTEKTDRSISKLHEKISVESKETSKGLSELHKRINNELKK